MKQLLSSLPLLLVCSTVLANSPTGEIIVKGKVITPSCSVKAENGGTFDLGKISAEKLTADVVSTTLTVTCEGNTYMLFSTKDNRESTATQTGNDKFGFGMYQEEKIGAYRVKIDSATVDGESKDLAYDTDDAYSFASVKAEQYLNTTPNSFIGWAENNNTLSVGKSFMANLSIYSTFATPEDLAEERNLDGSFTMNFRFGI